MMLSAVFNCGYVDPVVKRLLAKTPLNAIILCGACTYYFHKFEFLLFLDLLN